MSRGLIGCVARQGPYGFRGSSEDDGSGSSFFVGLAAEVFKLVAHCFRPSPTVTVISLSGAVLHTCLTCGGSRCVL